MRRWSLVFAVSVVALACGSTAGTFCERYSNYARSRSQCVRYNLTDGGTGISLCETAFSGKTCTTVEREALTATQTCLDRAGACLQGTADNCAEDAGLIDGQCTYDVFSSFD